MRAGMIIDFDTAYQNYYNLKLDEPRWPYPYIHTTAPIFISNENLDWFKQLYESRRIDHWDDFLYLNLVGIKLGKYKKMICLPAYQFTGIHHWQVKVETGLIKKGSLILTGTEEIVYMSHGKFWDNAYCEDLLKVMYKYLSMCDMGDWCKNRVEDAWKIVIGEFYKYLNLEY